MQNKTAPRWDLKNIYPDFKSKEYAESKKKIPALTSKFEKHLKAFSDKDLKKWLVKALDILNEFNAEAETLYAYASAVYTTDTENKEALSELNSISALFVPFTPLGVRFSNILASVSKEVKALIKNDKDLKYASFYLEDTLFWQKKQMSEEEESLAADLARSGASAWSKLQSTLTSTASCIWDEKTKEEKTLVQLRAMAYDKDAAVREKAFKKELELCKSIEKPVAAALNGVKGTSITLNKRRNWKGGTIEKSVKQANITQKTLDSLISAIEDSLPAWRKYLKAKAMLLGKKDLPFYDLFAPVSKSFPTYTWEEAKALVIENFSSFSKNMGDFAKKAFASNWIDGEVRNGKVSWGAPVESGIVYVDGLSVTDADPIVFRDRQKLASDGIVTCVVTVSKRTGKVGGVELSCRGVSFAIDELMGEIQDSVRESVEGSARKEGITMDTLRKTARNRLSNYLWGKTRTRPMVIPVVMEV